MKKKIALIFGVTGQDGAYLSKFLLNKNYVVYGVKRRSSTMNTTRIDDIYKDINYRSNFVLLYGDLTDASSILNIIKKLFLMKYITCCNHMCKFLLRFQNIVLM